MDVGKRGSASSSFFGANLCALGHSDPVSDDAADGYPCTLADCECVVLNGHTDTC
jgi:hypothetical protein